MFTKYLSAVIVIAFLFIINTLPSGCANIVPPVGGSRDSLAPVLLKVNPTNNALNNKEKTITLNFDEYIQVEDAINKVVISPLPNIPPEINGKLKTVTIKLKDSLEANTTYSIAINGAIKDVNEGNKLNDLVYTFSTGNYIDSNKISGKVILAETGKVDTTLIVILHNNLSDSAVTKQRPKYYTKLSADGSFSFINLPSKTFNIYTIADEGGQKKYQSPKQLFGYNATSINAANNITNVQLYAYIQEKEIPKIDDTKTTPKDKLKYSTNLSATGQDILSNLKIIFNQKTLTIDTNKLTLTDTTYKQNLSKQITVDSNKKEITLKTNWAPQTNYRLIIQNTFATDSKNNFLTKTDTLKFTTKAITEYGKVTIRFNALNLAQHWILQLVQNDNIAFTYPLKSLKLTIANLPPGEYDLRILQDDNNNGLWDTGSYYTTKKQPELVTLISKKLSVRADWDNELDLD